ncbi:LuxR family transcriptional regulator [Actinomadura sp. KC216]|uniref:AAA family ATPase n=1 Tax=Actinomadura sp. KC216 TaxID=2530370 RepID=UPI0010521F36|nr:LuxR family transcriptional regulator [Actinomadura sp. KC216]TDB89413.1 LuxR family transcriptional regulator [Actinomadura sp. KC216]
MGRQVIEGLVGRTAECARVARSIEDARSARGGALVITGEPGIGKTALLLDAVGRSQGHQVVVIRGVESEVELAGSGLGELIGAFADELGRLPESQANALRAVRGAAGRPAAASPYAIFAAVHGLVTLLAEERPLIVAVDDAHWLDPISRDALLFVGRRLTEHAALLLMTLRTHEPALDHRATGLPVLELPRLSMTDSHALLAALTVEIGIEPRVAAELAAAADGNPLAVRELVASLSAGQLRGHVALPETLAGGRALRGLMSSRVARLDADTGEALLIAALSVDADLAAVSRAVRTPESLEHAAAAGLITLTDGRVEFSHPLLRSAISDAASARARSRAYEALAATAADEVKVLYRAASARTPDEAIAGGLEHAAERARHAGGHLTAARTLRRAAELTGSAKARARRLLLAAADARSAGRLDLVEGWVRDAYAATDVAAVRADARTEYARAAMWSGQINKARAVFADALRHIGESDPGRAAEIHLELALLETMGGRPPDAAVAAVNALKYLSVEDMRSRRLPWPLAPHAMILNGDVAGGLELLDHGVLDLTPRETPHALPALCHTAQSFTWCERFGQAFELIDQVIEAARNASAPLILPDALAGRSEIAHWTGSWTIAAADAAEAVRLGRELDQLGAEAYAATRLGNVQADRGDAAALAMAGAAEELGARGGVDCMTAYANAIRGRFELGRSNFRGAARALDRLAAQLDEISLGNPLTVPWAADYIEVLIRTGRRDDALRRHADLAGQADRTGLSWPAAAAARCRALLASGDAADEHFEEAMSRHARVDVPFEQARTLLCWGNSLLSRRRRQPARAGEVLADALRTFERLRATPWIRQAQAALAAAGVAVPATVRTPGLDDLTAQELQVSLAVARGLSNPEVAAALFISRKTVERHLSAVYRKLGLRSRTELTAHVTRNGRSD